MKKVIVTILLLLIIVAAASCQNEEVKKEENYEKCTSVCSATITTEDFVTLHLCNEECKKQFLED